MREMSIGAEYFSSSLIPCIPFHTMASWAVQKARKQANSSGEVPSHGTDWASTEEGCLMDLGNRRKMASPPIHDSIPYHPQPTRARSSVGTWAPRIPNDDRARTGKGTPYFVPGWPVRIKGPSRIRLATTTVAIPCHQAIPRSTSDPAK